MYFSRKTVLALNCYKNLGKITAPYSTALPELGFGPELWAQRRRKRLGGHHLLLLPLPQSPHACHQQKAPSFLSQKSAAFHITVQPAEFFSLWPFSPQFSGTSWACLAGTWSQPQGRVEAGGTTEPETDEHFRLAWHRRSKRCQR